MKNRHLPAIGPVDRGLLMQQRIILGGMIDTYDSQIMSADEREALDGIWNLLHAIEDKWRITDENE